MVLTERRNKIFLIGNGFDLAHGLPTRYVDFITWYLKDCLQKALEYGKYEDDCILIKINKVEFSNNGINIYEFIEKSFVNNEIWKFVTKKDNAFVTLNSGYSRRDTSWLIKIEPKSEFCLNLLINCRNADWSGIEYEINRIMLKEHSALIDNRTKILIDRKSNKTYDSAWNRIKELNKSVYCLKSKLIEYLKFHNNPSLNKYNLLADRKNNGWGKDYIAPADKDEYIGKIKLRNIPNSDLQRAALFLNFNYTTYFEHQIVEKFEAEFKDGFTDLETIFIHGSLEEPIDDIVFGVGDENKENYSEIESLYDDDWLVPLKSFHYFRNEKYQQLLGFIARGHYEVYVIGHSCSTTDRTLLNMLFENKYCQKIHVYHYNGIESYLTTAYNIARNFNDKVRLREVLQPFNPDLSTK